MATVKWRRLWQPRRLLFWQMLVFNMLSSVCSWALRALPLSGAGMALVSVIALANVGFGLLAAWALLKDPAPGEIQPSARALEVTAAASAAPKSSPSTASTSE